MGVAAQCLHGARVCVIPRPENNFRPYALRHRSLVAVSALLIAAKSVALGLIALMPLPAELSTITSARIVQLANEERTKAGLQELVSNDALNRAALEKAQDMLDQDYFAHISPSGVTPWFWMSKAGYTYRLAGENLAIDFVEAENVVTAWMASPSHRDNLLQADYVETGVGVLTGEFEGSTSTVVVHMFGLPSATAAEPSQVAAQVTAPSPLPVADTVAPAIPTVVVGDARSAVQESVELNITGEPGSEITLLVNSQPRATLTLPTSGTIAYTLALDGVPDGEVVLRALARDSADNQSEPSPPQVLDKDTLGPEAAAEAMMFIASPAIDNPVVAMVLSTPDIASLAVAVGDSESRYDPDEAVVIPLSSSAIRLTLFDDHGNASVLGSEGLLPSFYTEPDTSYLGTSVRFSQITRRMILVAAVAIALLLGLAVIIRIQVQHPTMIVHTLLVLVLAGALLFL